MTDYKPGSFFLTQIGGATGFWIGLGQALAGSPSRYSHAGIVLDTDGTVLEAEPGGARIANLSEYAGRPLLVSDAPVQRWISTGWEEGCGSCQFGIHDACTGHFAGPVQWHNCPCNCSRENEIRQRVVAEARKLVGTPYSAADYLALAALHLHLPSGWIRRRVESSGHLICSALVDRVYANAGLHLFDDGRLSGDVMPADLAAYAEDHAS